MPGPSIVNIKAVDGITCPSWAGRGQMREFPHPASASGLLGGESTHCVRQNTAGWGSGRPLSGRPTSGHNVTRKYH